MEKFNFGLRLSTLRKTREMTQEELAAATGIHAATIRRIERRGIRPTLAIALKLAKALSVPPSILLGLSS